MNDFFKTVRSYLLEYLPNQKCFSENTVRSYKQALNLFVKYLREVRRLPIKQIEFKAINREIVLGFLDWLEQERLCSASSRNQRLMVLRAFFAYAGELDCTQMALHMEVSKVPVKKEPGRIVEFLTESALEALLAQPRPAASRLALRNRLFMLLMYDTAARCGELLNMRVRDLRLDTKHPIAYLHGKGNKTRTVPLLEKTVAHCRHYLQRFHADEPANSNSYIFYTTMHGIRHPMSADTAAEFMKQYGASAKHACPEMPDHVHPHMLRHTRAMHLYRQGMPLVLLSEYLGHASVRTTKIYAHADTEMKRAAIERADAVRNGAPAALPVWADDEDMILQLSGLV
jgi:site-specific recombinase XerD